jgi:hydrogenase maturation protein HypF
MENSPKHDSERHERARNFEHGQAFDAVSALLGLRNAVNYEGQAAIELEIIADKNSVQNYEFEIAENGIIKCETVIRKAVEDLLNGVSASRVSAGFHLAAVDLIAKIARAARNARNLNRVALSGGVLQNMFLLERVCRQLESEGFEVLTHSRVPANGGGISLRQAAIANACFESCRSAVLTAILIDYGGCFSAATA